MFLGGSGAGNIGTVIQGFAGMTASRSKSLFLLSKAATRFFLPITLMMPTVCFFHDFRGVSHPNVIDLSGGYVTPTPQKGPHSYHAITVYSTVLMTSSLS